MLVPDLIHDLPAVQQPRLLFGDRLLELLQFALLVRQLRLIVRELGLVLGALALGLGTRRGKKRARIQRGSDRNGVGAYGERYCGDSVGESARKLGL